MMRDWFAAIAAKHQSAAENEVTEVTRVTAVTTVTGAGVGHLAPLLVTSVTRVTSVTLAFDEIAFAERAALVEFDAGVPRHWAEGFAQLSLMARPEEIGEPSWSSLIDAAGRLLDKWSRHLLEFGWSIDEIFENQWTSESARNDRVGLVQSLTDGDVVEVHRDHAVIANDNGGCRIHWRRPARQNARPRLVRKPGAALSDCCDPAMRRSLTAHQSTPTAADAAADVAGFTSMAAGEL